MPGRRSTQRPAVHERLALEVEELRSRLGGLPSPAEAEDIWTEIWYREAHSSTAIEGNTLILRQVEALLSEGLAVGNKELKEYLEVQGYATAAKWVYGHAIEPGGWRGDSLISLTEVRHVHALAMGPVWEVAPHPAALDTEAPGNWRQHNIRAFPGGMKPPDFTEVAALLGDWVDDACRIPVDTAPIADAVAKRHVAFERIHPFLDGNGRTGRLLTNLILVRLGYPPAIIEKNQRRQYLEALQAADDGDPGSLGALFAHAILDNLMRFIYPAIAGPARLVPLEALATRDLSATALLWAARRSRLRAMRRSDGTWMSNRRWVDEYRASRYASLRQPRASASGAQSR